MSQLLERMKASHLEARKARLASKAATLGVFLGDVEATQKRDGVPVTDAAVVDQLKKYIKNAGVLGANAEQYGDQLASDQATEEIALWQSFLPKQLTEDEVHHAVQRIINAAATKPKMGEVLASLKTDYAGQYDGAMAAKIVKAALA